MFKFFQGEFFISHKFTIYWLKIFIHLIKYLNSQFHDMIIFLLNHLKNMKTIIKLYIKYKKKDRKIPSTKVILMMLIVYINFFKIKHVNKILKRANNTNKNS